MRLKTLLYLTLVVVFSTAAFAGNVLVQNGSWGQYAPNENDMAAVFGANYTEYNFSVSAALAFSAGNKFVFVEGGDGQDSNFQTFLTTNQAFILNWVSNGGALLLQSAGWYAPAFTFGPGTIGAGQSDLSFCGTLTAAGTVAFPTTPVSQCGNYLSHDDITGAGLTAFMTGNAGDNVAGIKFGGGYIMYTGLTDSQFHNAGGSLNQNVIAYTAAQGTPEPGTLIMLGTGILGLAGTIRRKINR